jgi:phosphopantetheine adenylyltransferase
MVREIATFGGNVSHLISPHVATALHQRLQESR